MTIRRNPTRQVRIGAIYVGADHPIAVQSMTATRTTDIDATVALVNFLEQAGAGVVRIAGEFPPRLLRPCRYRR